MVIYRDPGPGDSGQTGRGRQTGDLHRTGAAVHRYRDGRRSQAATRRRPGAAADGTYGLVRGRGHVLRGRA